MQEEDNKGQEPIKAYISGLIFNDGNRLSVKKDDIVLFVGPNNAGKSQSLNDIYSLSENNYKGIVITGISIEKTEGSLKLLLEAVSSKTENMDYNSYYCMGNGVNYFSNTDSEFLNYDGLGQFRNWFVVKLDTATRLSICFPANNIGRKDAKENPIHYAAFDYNKYGKWLSDNFKKAFGSGIIANSLYGSSIPLCIGDEVHFDEEFDNETARTDKYASILSSYKQVQNQGDGIRSFTGILLYLMLQYLSIYLIDEPESFLHPPQARIMGQIIGETLNNNQQAFISTHSEEIVKGLLDVCGNRLRIVRITREEDVNTFSILDSQKVMEIFDDPLLKYSNIMSSIFHKTVVLCESDSDCKLYSIIDGNIKQEEGKYSETLFIHCGGKHRMSKTAKALLSLDIDVRLICNDLLSRENLQGVTTNLFNCY